MLKGFTLLSRTQSVKCATKVSKVTRRATRLESQVRALGAAYDLHTFT